MRKTTFLAKAAIGLAIMLVAGPAFAQTPGAGLPTSAARSAEERRNLAAMDLGDRRTPGRRQVPAGQVRSESLAALTATTTNCAYEKGAFLGEADDRNTYEVVCSNGPGYIVVTGDQPQVFNCVALAGTATRLRASDPQAEVGTQCSLPENTDIVRSVKPLVVAAGVECQVDSAKWIGETEKGQRYEVGCAGSDGYWLEAGASGQPEGVIDCLRLVAAGRECSLTTPAEQGGSIGRRLAGQGADGCAIEAARFAGANQANEQFYEVKCASGDGYFYQTGADGAFKQAIPCVDGARLGGCKLLDNATLAAQMLSQHTALLGGASIPCAATASRAMGTETDVGREVVEFVCSDRPLGLIGLFPKNGAGADYGTEIMDCLTASWRTLVCELTTPDKIKASLSAMAAAGGGNCDVTAFRVFARNQANNGDRIEVKCASGGGFVGDFPDARVGAAHVNPCDRLPAGDPVCRL